MELSNEALASFRVKQTGGISYRAIDINADLKAKRRSYMRQILKEYPQWCNASNDMLDQMILYRSKDGYIIQDIRGYDFFMADNKVSGAEAKFRRIRAMMPFEFMNLTGKDFEWSKYGTDVSSEKDIINKFIMHYPKFREKGMGLYIFSGTKGSGKTMLSCCVLNEISKRYEGSVKFINVLDFLELTRKGFQSGADEVKSLYDASILVIDDIGVQMSKEWIDTVFYRLINDRYVNRRPTIYTSNMPMDALKMDDRITDRIDNTTFLVHLPEESIRKRDRQQEKDRILSEI